jgi:hypothetical protein
MAGLFLSLCCDNPMPERAVKEYSNFFPSRRSLSLRKLILDSGIFRTAICDELGTPCAISLLDF